MKNTFASLIVLTVLSLLTSSAFAQGKTTKADIKVYGNCGMCKERIEKALDHKGIKVANWDVRSKNLHVVYNPKKINEQDIHNLIAGVGHDTDKSKAKNETYADLPFCCLYRDHDHSGIQDKPAQHKDH